MWSEWKSISNDISLAIHANGAGSISKTFVTTGSQTLIVCNSGGIDEGNISFYITTNDENAEITTIDYNNYASTIAGYTSYTTNGIYLVKASEGTTITVNSSYRYRSCYVAFLNT